MPIFGLAVWFVVGSLVTGPCAPWLAGGLGALGWLAMRALAAGAVLLGGAWRGHDLGLPVPGLFKLLSLLLLTALLLVLLKGARGLRWRRSAAVIGACLIILAGVTLTAFQKSRDDGPRLHRLCDRA